MTKRLLFSSLIGVLTACHHEADIQPGVSSLSSEVVGTYNTNFYLDPAVATIPANQLTYAELKAESDSNVTLIITQLYPTKDTQVVKHILLSRQAEGIQLRAANSIIGTLQTDRVFTNNGMEKQGQLLRINTQTDLNFAGVKH